MEVSSEEKTMAGLSQLSFLVGLGIIVPLIIWLIKKDTSEFIKKNVKQALGWQIAMVVVFIGLMIVASILTFIIPLLGFLTGLIYLALGICVLVFGIMAGVKNFKGEDYIYPVIGNYIDGIGK